MAGLQVLENRIPVNVSKGNYCRNDRSDRLLGQRSEQHHTLLSKYTLLFVDGALDTRQDYKRQTEVDPIGWTGIGATLERESAAFPVPLPIRGDI